MSDALGTVEVAPEAIAASVIEENLSESGESENPFLLTEDHEFKAPETPQMQQELNSVISTQVDIVRVAINPPEQVPAFPGTPESDYRRCPCIGVMPGRACPRCHNSKWVKTCPKCEGEMFVSSKVRKGAHARTERCGFCMGLGQVAARLGEVRDAEEAAKAYRANSVPGKGIVPRGPQLPGTRVDRSAAKAAQVKARNQKKYGRQKGH